MSAKKKTSTKAGGEKEETKQKESNLRSGEDPKDHSQETMNDGGTQIENEQPGTVQTEAFEPETMEEISLSPEEITKLVREKVYALISVFPEVLKSAV